MTFATFVAIASIILLALLGLANLVVVWATERTEDYYRELNSELNRELGAAIKARYTNASVVDNETVTTPNTEDADMTPTDATTNTTTDSETTTMTTTTTTTKTTVETITEPVVQAQDEDLDTPAYAGGTRLHRAMNWNPSKDNREQHSRVYKVGKARRVKPPHKRW